ncbi:hypothetical protein BH10PSE19_BH10PSE19_05010 [soil metagenome]
MYNSHIAAIILENNWERVKAELHRTWRHLTAEQIAAINTYKDLVAQLKISYEITEEEVMGRINKFIEKLNFENNLSRFEEFKAALYEGAHEARDKIGEVVSNSADAVQGKTVDWAQLAASYAKENPLKALGLGILIVAVVKKLLIDK